MPFFLRGKRPGDKKKKPGVKRRKPNGLQQEKNVESKVKLPNDLDEEITSEEDEDYVKKSEGKLPIHQKDEDDEDETAQEKKVRLARQYLKELQEQKTKDDDDDEKLDDDTLGVRLQEDVLEASGMLRKNVAELYTEPSVDDIYKMRSKQQKLSITCLVVTNDEQFIFTGSKDCSIVKFTFKGKKVGCVPGGRKGTENEHVGHTSHIFAMAVSSDSKFMASGDEGGYIHIWDAESLEHLKTFKKHRTTISGLAFRRSSHTLFSASYDRMVMVWNLDAMAFVENLGGHQDGITGIDSHVRESCITSGGRDQSVIIYVLAEDKQLRFNGHQDSIDGVKLVNEKTFITYGQDGSLALWSTLKKRPHCVVKAAHGFQENGQPNWLTAIATLINTDLIASGSMDGNVRLWCVDTKGYRSINPLFSVPVPGIVNSLAFTATGSHLVAGVGQEHKLGRWYRQREARNTVVVIPMKKK